MKIFYSGEEDKATPERVLGKKANIMFTFWNQQKKPHKRMRFVIEFRKKGKRKCPQP